MPRVYMDANATTPLLPEVLEAMRPYWMDRFGNASSIHFDGQQAHAAVDRARETLAEFFNCHPAEVVFNSGGTEGDNTAVFGMLRPGDHFVTTAIEHSAVLQAAERMARLGVETTYVPPQPSGLIDPAEIESALRSNTRLVSVMLANNETGVLQPVEEIGRIARAGGAFFHIDAVQGAGKVAIDVRRLGCHLLTVSAHKMHGPKGVGAIFVRRGTPIESLLVGGSHERRRRAGTENVPGIVGLAKAVDLAMLALEDGTVDRLAALRDRLEAGLLRIPGTAVNGSLSLECHPERAPFSGFHPDRDSILDCRPERAPFLDCHPERAKRVEGPAVATSTGSPVPRVANTSNIRFDRLEGEALVIALDLKGMAVSGGSACHSGATEPSHVLMAMGLDKNQARASLRFSLLRTATDADVDCVLKVVPEAVERLRELSPVAAGTAG